VGWAVAEGMRCRPYRGLKISGRTSSGVDFSISATTHTQRDGTRFHPDTACCLIPQARAICDLKPGLEKIRAQVLSDLLATGALVMIDSILCKGSLLQGICGTLRSTTL
jgi:hypothetical protein